MDDRVVNHSKSPSDNVDHHIHHHVVVNMMRCVSQTYNKNMQVKVHTLTDNHLLDGLGQLVRKVWISMSSDWIPLMTSS